MIFQGPKSSQLYTVGIFGSSYTKGTFCLFFLHSYHTAGSFLLAYEPLMMQVYIDWSSSSVTPTVVQAALKKGLCQCRLLLPFGSFSIKSENVTFVLSGNCKWETVTLMCLQVCERKSIHLSIPGL